MKKTNLDDVWRWCTEQLRSLDGPWKLPVLATCGRLGPRARVVVARHFSWPELHVYSDSRAQKIDDIETDPRVSLAYYDEREKVQIRLRGKAQVITDGPTAEQLYHDLPSYSRGDYLTKDPPGSLSEEPGTKSEASTPHFALIKIRLRELEWLQLSREGHLRACFVDPETGRWLVP